MEIILWTIVATTSILFYGYKMKKTWKEPEEAFPLKWKSILAQKVNFYNALNTEEKSLFEYEIQEFLLNYSIIGVEVDLDLVDKLLVAASGVIPVFKFPEWRYTNLREIYIYPNSFNLDFETSGPDRRILGMVGTGYLEGKMILSKKALHHGFDVDNDKRNTAIHEFIHLIDKIDGSIDGIPKILLERPYVLPWLDLIHEKMDAIYQDNSDINPYGGTSKIEFFAVACEYFFEQPKLMSKKHPELYDLLEKIFEHEMDQRDLKRKIVSLGRNNPCPCQSGKKYKHCCSLSA